MYSLYQSNALVLPKLSYGYELSTCHPEATIMVTKVLHTVRDPDYL